jgi:hypothetical protein
VEHLEECRRQEEIISDKFRERTCLVLLRLNLLLLRERERERESLRLVSSANTFHPMKWPIIDTRVQTSAQKSGDILLYLIIPLLVLIRNDDSHFLHLCIPRLLNIPPFMLLSSAHSIA